MELLEPGMRQADLVLLARLLFGHDHWSVPSDIIRAIFRPNARVAVKGCHSSGKTYAAGDIVPLALLVGADVVTTAPTDDQVRGQLWRNVHEALRDCIIPPEEWGAVNQTEIRLPSGERAFGRSTNMGVRFHGEHARKGRPLIVMVDEAPGVIADVMGAIEGMRAGGDVRVLIQGNPLEPSGPFYDAFHPPGGQASTWDCYTIGAFDTPNLEGLTIEDVLAMSDADLDANPRPYLITRRYVKEKYLEWGPDHWEYMGRVLGLFPDQSTESLFTAAWLDAAARRSGLITAGHDVIAAIDVAGPGEAETVLTIRRGEEIVHGQGFTDADARDPVMDVLDEWVSRGLTEIRIDSVGIGWYFYLDMKDEYEQHNVNVRAINVGQPSQVMTRDPQTKRIQPKFANLKAEYYWHLRDLAAKGKIAGLPSKAHAQLRTIKYEHPNGVTKIESKKDARKRGVASPDWAESIMLLYAPDDPLNAYAGAFGRSGRMGASAPSDGRPPGWEGAFTWGVKSVEPRTRRGR